MQNADQEATVEITAVIARAVPCEHHAEKATGEDVPYDGGVVSPNGYDPRCPACVAMPRVVEHRVLVEG